MKDPMQNKKEMPQREVDQLTEDIGSWWGKTFVFIKKTRIKTWKGIFIIAFTTGVAAATVWMVSFNIQTSSDAAQGATLTLFTDDTNVTTDDGTNLVNMTVLLNSHSNNVVTVKAVVNFDPANFELQSWDTSNSIFSIQQNTCEYQGKKCQIVDDSKKTEGQVTITIAMPSPGKVTETGIIGELVFKALQNVNPTAPNFTIEYTSGSYEDSDVILDDGNGTDILTSALGATVYVGTPVCETTTCLEWGVCEFGTKTCVTPQYLPEGCMPQNPISEDCTSPVCIGWQYTSWGACQPNGKKYHNVVPGSGTPHGCEGGIPVIEEECNCEGTDMCTHFEYSNEWSACVNGKQHREITSMTPAGCCGGNPEIEKNCDIPSCEFTYTEWGACQNGAQARTVVSSTPEGCQGGTPVLSQACNNPVVEDDDDDEEEEKKDKEKPKFTDLPRFLTKNRGDMIWWKAKDNKKVVKSRYAFMGKYVNTSKNHFHVPVNTPPGLHTLTVRVYDKAGNQAKRTIVIRVK